MTGYRKAEKNTPRSARTDIFRGVIFYYEYRNVSNWSAVLHKQDRKRLCNMAKNYLDILSKNRTFFESPCFISENLLKCVQSMNESSGTCAPGEFHNYFKEDDSYENDLSS